MIICFLILYLNVQTVWSQRNNICNNFDAYLTNVNTNPDCYYSEDATLTAFGITKKYGGKYFETFNVVSEDGYTSKIIRLKQETIKPVVLLYHSILVNSRLYVWNGPESIAFKLWKQGYDVWLANDRGTDTDTFNTNFTYWNFGFHEIAQFDIPAIVSEIHTRTNNSNSKIVFIGHSMGATIGLVYTTLYPLAAKENFKAFILIAAPAFFQYSASGFRLILPFYSIIKNFFESNRIGSLVPFLSPLSNTIRYFVYTFPEIIIPIVSVVQSICGNNPDEMNPLFFNMDSAINAKDCSWRMVYHYAQLLRARNRFQMFSYGIDGNMIIYGSQIPPEYQIDKIRVPIILFSGYNDSLIHYKDCDTIFNKLPKQFQIRHHILNGYNHLDFMIRKNNRPFVDLLLAETKKLLTL